MSDVDAALSDIEQRLHALEAELEWQPAASQPEPPHATRPHAAAPRPHRAEPPAADDPFDRFGIELRRLATELVDAWERVAAHERGSPTGLRRVVLETRVDVHALAALERALTESPHVRGVELRAYAAGQASLLVDLA